MTEELHTCTQCHRELPSSGFYKYTQDFYKNDRSLKPNHRKGEFLQPCKECRKGSRAQHNPTKKQIAKDVRTPTDLSWNSILGVAPIEKEKSNT